MNMDLKTFQRAAEIVAEGSVLSFGPVRVLVDRIEQIAAGLFYIEAGNTNGHAGHILEFASAKELPGGGIQFFDEAGKQTAYLTTIEDADVDDSVFYRTFWNGWAESMRDPENKRFQDEDATLEKRILGIGAQP